MPNTHITSDLPLTIDDAGAGRPVLVLHGGGGLATVAMIAGRLALTMQVITPTLPGWNGTERPERIRGIDDLAAVFLQYLEDQDLTDTLVIGSSIGGWIAADGGPAYWQRDALWSVLLSGRATVGQLTLIEQLIPRAGPPPYASGWPKASTSCPVRSICRQRHPDPVATGAAQLVPPGTRHSFTVS